MVQSVQYAEIGTRIGVLKDKPSVWLSEVTYYLLDPGIYVRIYDMHPGDLSNYVQGIRIIKGRLH
jgi:hypothetical protein